VRTLVLWDIDGTLVTTVPHGRDAFADAYEAVTGRPADGLVSMAGRTDLEIAHEILGRHGVDASDELLQRFGDELNASLRRRAERIPIDGHAKPGAAETIDALSREPGVVQSLLTGNIAPNARIKLEVFGLDRHLDFEIGAYGSDHRMRPELVGIAVGKARAKLGGDFAPVLIGDTPLDIAAARAYGARSVGVATGPFGVEDLHEADAVLSDLSDTEASLDAILNRR